MHRGGADREAAGLWGKAGQRSLERSALVEAVEQFTRALDQIATLPATPALRREEIKLQVALDNPTDPIKECGAGNQSRCGAGTLLIEQTCRSCDPWVAFVKSVCNINVFRIFSSMLEQSFSGSFTVSFTASVHFSLRALSWRMIAFVAALRSTYRRMILPTFSSDQPRISAITRSERPAI